MGEEHARGLIRSISAAGRARALGVSGCASGWRARFGRGSEVQDRLVCCFDGAALATYIGLYIACLLHRRVALGAAGVGLGIIHGRLLFTD